MLALKVVTLARLGKEVLSSFRCNRDLAVDEAIFPISFCPHFAGVVLSRAGTEGNMEKCLSPNKY